MADIMTREASTMEQPSGADIASGRAVFYDLLAAVFGRLPDRGLLIKIRDGEFGSLLGKYGCLDEKGFRLGLDRISTYQVSIKERSGEEVLTELAVDRTKIMRGTGDAGMKPPYEGVYRGGKPGVPILKVKQFYRKAELVPGETVNDSADYLCVELDFMKQLCLREKVLRHGDGEAGENIALIIALQEEFLGMHLGSWVGEFCHAVGKYAFTDFYRGFALILDAHIRSDSKRLRSILQ